MSAPEQRGLEETPEPTRENGARQAEREPNVAAREHTMPQSQTRAPELQDAAAAQSVDLNHAPASQLAPLVGETCARAVVDHRVHHGHFRSWDDVRAVPGMDEAALVQLQQAARIGNR